MTFSIPVAFVVVNVRNLSSDIKHAFKFYIFHNRRFAVAKKYLTYTLLTTKRMSNCNQDKSTLFISHTDETEGSKY